MECFECDQSINPAKDFFITVNERKGPSRNFCSPTCTTTYLNDEEV